MRNRKLYFSFGTSDVFSLLPAVLWYTEREEFEDEEVFMISLRLFVFQIFIGVQIREKP